MQNTLMHLISFSNSKKEKIFSTLISIDIKETERILISVQVGFFTITFLYDLTITSSVTTPFS